MEIFSVLFLTKKMSRNPIFSLGWRFVVQTVDDIAFSQLFLYKGHTMFVLITKKKTKLKQHVAIYPLFLCTNKKYP